MKFDYDEIKMLKKIIKNEQQSIDTILNSIGINSTEHKKIKNKKKILDSIINKISNNSIPGASEKQINSLVKIAKKKVNVSKNKVQNAINILLLYNKRISINSVAKEAAISYNTAKKFKPIIEETEKHRNK